MSDNVIQSNNDDDGMHRSSMHLYQSVWMAHWTQTSCKSETRDDKPLSFHCMSKKEDCDFKQQGSEIPSHISKHAEGFEVSESRTANIMDENIKLGSMKSGKEMSEGLFFPKLSLSDKESTIELNVTTCQGGVPKMGTSSGECHFQHEGILGDLELQVKSHESPVRKSLAVSKSFKQNAGSSSNFVLYRYNSRKSPIQSIISREEEMNQSSPAVASQEHLRNSKFQSYSTSLVHDKTANNPLGFRRSGTSSSRQNNVHLLLNEPSASNDQLPVFIGKQRGKTHNHSGTRLFPNWGNPLDATKMGTSFYDFFSVPRILQSLHDVESMRICNTEGHPKLSQTTHHFLITKKTDVDLSEGGETFKEKMLSKFLSLSPDFGFHEQQGVKLQSLGSTTDSEEKENIGDNKTSAVCLKNESLADTDTMDMDVFRKNHFSVMVSSPTNEVARVDEVARSQAVVASTREETGGRLPNIELPDINQELPALPSVADSVDDRETSSSRTQSLDVEHLPSHVELPTNSKSGAFPDGRMGSDPSIRWVKRLKLSAPGSFAHGTKSSETEEASSHEKVNKFVNEITRCNITNSEPTIGRCSDKEPMALDQTAGFLKNGDSSFSKTQRKPQDITLSNSWIRRWCHERSASRTENRDEVTLCEPRSSKSTLDELQKKQFPSIGAMALMGKVLNTFQQCEFRKKGSYIVWKTWGC
ncbi:uncharacterized protein LOC123227546 isoform X2 [Mangifera indica]|uniref:uncharacterized protein LOC123227546 isoform X2 n=1 Tax=Mangifera indica TaxID=29780 RepID=UPI001CFC2DD6|nr:uncharacterized protein LOC123227546 isoform X2 [Mangifera indica]